MRKLAAVLVLVVAAVVWGWRFWPAGTPTEAALRQTTGLSAEVMTMRNVPQGVEVTCRVSNATARATAQVVLNVTLNDGRGARLAANPLVGVAEVPAQAARETVVLVPLRQPPTDARAQVEVTLVRWSK